MTDEPVQTFVSVWDALATTPDQAANMRLRAQLVVAIDQAVEAWGMPRVAAAARLRLTSAEFTELIQGRLDMFSVDELTTIAERAGLIVEMRIAQAAE